MKRKLLRLVTGTSSHSTHCKQADGRIHLHSLQRSVSFDDYQAFLNNEARYTRLVKPFPERADRLFKESEEAAKARYEHLQKLVELLQIERA